MKKFLFLAIIVLAFFTIDHPEINKYRDALVGEGHNLLNDQTIVTRSTAAKLARSVITERLELDETELEYLDEILSSDDKLQAFHLRYCKENDLNLYFYGNKLTEICRIAKEAIFQGKTL